MKQEGIDFSQLSEEERIKLLRDKKLTDKEQALLFATFDIPKEKYQPLLEQGKQEQNKKNEEKTINSKLSEEEQFKKIKQGMGNLYEKQSDAEKKDVFSYLHKEEGYTLSQKRYEELLAKENKKENEKYNGKNPKEDVDKVTENGNLSATIDKHQNVGEKVKTQNNIEIDKNNVTIVDLNNGSKH